MVEKIADSFEKPIGFLRDNKIFTGAVVACVLLVTVMIGCQSRSNDLTALEITSPQNRAEITEEEVMVSGIVSPPSAVMTINGIEADVESDGTFSRRVELEYGENSIHVKALTEAGEELTSKILTVIRNLDLEILSPQDKDEVSYSPIVLRGIVSDSDAVVRVNGREIGVAEDGSFYTAIDLNYVKNVLVVEATVAGQNPVSRTISVNRVLLLQLDSTVYQFEVTEGTTEVKGVVYPPSAVVTVNGQEVDTTADGSFSAVIELDYGENIIIINATDPVTRTITVNRDLTLEVTSPSDGDEFTGDTVTVSGVVSDPMVTVTVNENPVEIAEDGAFAVGVPLDYGANPIEVRAFTEGEDAVVRTESLMVNRVLTLNVNAPRSGSEFTETPVILEGIVSDPLAVVTVGDEIIAVGENGDFSASVALETGENVITVTASVSEDVSLVRTLTLYYVPSG